MEVSVQEKDIREIKASYAHSSLNKSLKVTIGIPAYNEKGNIGFLISELLSHISSNVVEIIVSDDGSTDGTSAEVLQVARKTKDHRCAVEVIEGKQRVGKAAAIDKILKVARGNVIVLIDADTRLSKHCVDKLTEPFSKDEKVGVVSGNILPLNSNGENKFFSFISNFQQELNDQLCQRLVNKNLAPKVNGAFFAFLKDIVDQIPHSVVSDDEYISWRAQNRGYKITYVPDAKVYTEDPVNVRDYLSKRRRILGGHFLIRNTSHYNVPTTRIDVLLPEFGKLVVKYWKKMFYVITMLFLESLCRPFAFSDAVRRKVSPCYRIDSARFAVKRGKP